MMKAAALTRRRVLAAGSLALAGAGGSAGCSERDTPPPPATWVGAQHERGHHLRDLKVLPKPAVQRQAGVVIVGAGISGLSAARGFARAGVQDVHLLELEDGAGGNSRSHALAGMACPLGAHYLPLPAPESHEVSEWLHEVGLLRSELGRTVADERHLCHSPQERLFIDGAWAEGLLPPADPGGATAQQYRRFAQALRQVQAQVLGEAPRRAGRGARAFALPAHRSVWTPTLAALNGVNFATWLAQQGVDDPHLRWYLDYCCRDDYGAGADTVSAWAGLHYFASRHGFHAPGEDSGERDAVFTWPQGNAWLAQQLATPLQGRLHTGRTVLRVTEGRHGVQVLAWDHATQRAETWSTPQVVLAVPLFIAARVLEPAPDALRQAATLLQMAPWLVANLRLDEPLLDRPGAPPSWDNVVYSQHGLGYVDAMHQSLRPYAGATVLTAYHALPATDRATLLAGAPELWRDRVLQDLQAAHPDIHRRVRQVALMRWGHAMAVPRPGVQRHPALMALRATRGRVRFAHADLAGCSVFEEAFTAGCEVALPAPPKA
jgi:monoamine oxidase